MAKLKNRLNYFLAMMVPFIANNLVAQETADAEKPKSAESAEEAAESATGNTRVSETFVLD